MISSFELENQRSKEKISVSQSADYSFIFNDGGIDWGSIQAVHNTFTFPNQIGHTIASTKMNGRQITIQGYVHGGYNYSKVKEYGFKEALDVAYNEMLQNKRKLNEMINPNDFIRMIIGDYFIEGKPEQTIVYGKEEEDNNEYFCKFFISLYCANPMFRKQSKEENKLKESVALFHFPLVLKRNGIALSSREEYLMLPVYNEGNNEVGGIITITAKDRIVNPEIERVDTGEKIIIAKTMEKNEKIVINTNNGEKSIIGIVNGVEENYFRYWGFNNSWIKFEEGTTLIGYSTESHNESMLDVSIEIYPEKFALEDM